MIKLDIDQVIFFHVAEEMIIFDACSLHKHNNIFIVYLNNVKFHCTLTEGNHNFK